MIDAAPRYLLVAITCAILYNAVLIVGDFLGLHYIVSSLISYATGVFLGYGLHSAFTFGRELSAKSLLRYALGLAVNLPISIALMFLFCDVAGIAVAVAAPMTTAIIFAWNFATSYWAIVGQPSLPKAG